MKNLNLRTIWMIGFPLYRRYRIIIKYIIKWIFVYLINLWIFINPYLLQTLNFFCEIYYVHKHKLNKLMNIVTNTNNNIPNPKPSLQLKVSTIIIISNYFWFVSSFKVFPGAHFRVLVFEHYCFWLLHYTTLYTLCTPFK